MNKFGWSYPPGCSRTPFDDDPPCEVCGKFVEDCVCPICPRCGSQGDPKCYQDPDLQVCGELHGKETWDQLIAKQEFEIACIKENLNEAYQYLDYLKIRKEEEEEKKKNA